VVVSDGADPATRAVIAQVAADAPCPVFGIEGPRRGAAAARNEGIARASGRIVLMVDDDIIAAPDLLAEHARHHHGRDDIIVLGNLPLDGVADEQFHHRIMRQWWHELLADKASPAHRLTFRDFATGNVSVSRARLLAAGGFDPAFTGYGREDYELGYRLQRAGLTFIYEPRAIGVHRYRKPLLDWLRQSRQMGRADVIFARKHPELVGAIMTLTPFPRLPWIPRAVATGEWIAAALNARGGPVWGLAVRLTHGAYYWRGVRDEARDSGELRWLVESRG
jgi:GT2 family glycosyltransferase